MGELMLTTLRLNRRHPQAWAEWRDVCRMHARVVDATVGMPRHPEGRVLWAQPYPWVLVVRATEPVTWQRLPAGYAQEIIHREWTPPVAGPHRAVVVCNPVKQRTEIRADGSRRNHRTPITGRGEQVAWLHGLLGPLVDGLQVAVTDERVRKGRHREGHTVVHRLLTVRLSGVVRDHTTLAAVVTRGFGRARSYGGGLSIWESLR